MTNVRGTDGTPRRLTAVVTVVLLTAVLAGCGATRGSSDTRAPNMYDVGGHDLYLSCTGDGPVTVVYVHGWVQDQSYVPHDSATGIRDRLADDYRVCLYDRRNVGSSETVDAVQTPADMLHDMEAVLKAGGAEPPYILMAASFGGLVASLYLQAHPDDVEGMVLIDAHFPDELSLDRLLPREDRSVSLRQEDMCCSVERIAQYDLFGSLQPGIGKEPAIPVVYLASKQDQLDENGYGSPKYRARVRGALRAYVDRFSPGIFRWVDAPHFMEPVVPGVISDAVREVDQLARRN
jgi:pimeloyl-ACP methyl ester carboxylesterase